jgi:hypothetical protein
MNIRELIEQHPAVTRDRHELTFTAWDAPEAGAEAFSQHGVVMLRGAMPATALLPGHLAFHRFARTQGEDPYGSWHRPWAVRYWHYRPTATVISRLVRSWAWGMVERLCGSSDIAILLSLCMARHAIDRDLGVGAHQDAQGLPPVVPFSMWLPLHGVVPGRKSGLGFVTDPPGRLLPVPPGSDLDLGDRVVLDNLDSVWVPTYQSGDLTIHDRYTPHFTTGYGTGSHRYSIEIRAMARDAAPEALQDPTVYVGRRDGVPEVVDSHCSAGLHAHEFLDAVARR